MSDTISKKITLKKVNNEVVEPIKIKKKDDLPVKGSNIYPTPFVNVAFCAKTKSGKTSLIFKMIKERVDKDTQIIAFVSTINVDAVWKEIKKWCKKHEITFQGLSSLKEGKNDYLDSFVKNLEEKHGEESDLESDLEEPEDYDEEEEIKMKKMNEKMMNGCVVRKQKKLKFFGQGDEDSEDEDLDRYEKDLDEEERLFGKKALVKDILESRMFKKKESSLKPKAKWIAPKFLIIFDDLSDEMRLPSVQSLLCKSRHYKCEVYLSSQYIHHFGPAQLKQISCLILFKSIAPKKLEKIKEDTDLNIDQETLQTLYDDATREPYNFLYIDCRNDIYRKNLDKQYIIYDK